MPVGVDIIIRAALLAFYALALVYVLYNLGVFFRKGNKPKTNNKPDSSLAHYGLVTVFLFLEITKHSLYIAYNDPLIRIAWWVSIAAQCALEIVLLKTSKFLFDNKLKLNANKNNAVIWLAGIFCVLLCTAGIVFSTPFHMGLYSTIFFSDALHLTLASVFFLVVSFAISYWLDAVKISGETHAARMQAANQVAIDSKIVESFQVIESNNLMSVCRIFF
jgi:hypothetical protein